MNAQPAIEAAKIAAEAASKNAEKTLLITVIMALFSLLGVLASAYISSKSAANASKITENLGEQNIKSSEQKRYIDAISAERVKWINIMRDRFSEFIKLTHLQMEGFNYWKAMGFEKLDENSEKDEIELKEYVSKELRERFYEITYVDVQITLLLNPKETISNKMMQLQHEIKSELNSTHYISEFNFNEQADLLAELIYLQQVVLKSEWKRVKEENKIGEEIDDDTMNSIYRSVAKS